MVSKLLRFRHIIFLLVLTTISLYFDRFASAKIPLIRTAVADSAMIFITHLETVWVALMLVFIPYLLSKTKRRYIFALMGSIVLTLVLALALKNLFLADRPSIPQLTTELTPGFPSLHAAIVFSIFPIIKETYKKISVTWLAFALLVAFSRIYVGVHFISDVIGGITLGLFCGEFFLWLEKKHNLSQRMLSIHFELRRQIAHAVIGIVLALGLHMNLLGTKDIGLMFILGTVLLLAYKKYPDKIPVITPLLGFFERKKDRLHFPGRGSFFLILGVLLTVILFPRFIAIPAIIIMAVGDSVTNIAGRYFGALRNPLNPNKTLEGSLAGFICALGASTLFMSFWPAFFACVGAMFLESIPFKYGKHEIDDNIIVPLAAGWIMSIWFS
jgi:undecaprenyl-diphosphatase